MEGDGEEVNNDQEFRFADLEFADPNNQASYGYYQRQLVNNKQLHTRFLTNSKKELANNLKKTRTDALLKLIAIEKDYVVSQSHAKVDKLVENNKEFSTLVNSVDFDDQQIQGFESHIDKENRDALVKHINFVEEIDNLTQEFQLPSVVPATSSGEGASPSPRFVNRPDLAEGCSQLTEDANYKQTVEFIEKAENWYAGTWPGCTDKIKMKKEIYNKLSRHLKAELV